MDQISMFEDEYMFPSSYDDIQEIYRNHIYDGEKDEIAFRWKDKKNDRSYSFYGEKVFAFYPDQGKGAKFTICETVGEKKKEILVKPLDFGKAVEKLKKRYQYLARNTIIETFACCNDFKRCSAVDSCLHQKEIFYNGCYYRTNLEAGRNFYKE